MLTGGIFYCRVSAGFSVSASNKLSCILTVTCSEIGNKNIPPIRWQQAEEKGQWLNLWLTTKRRVCESEKRH